MRRRNKLLSKHRVGREEGAEGWTGRRRVTGAGSRKVWMRQTRSGDESVHPRGRRWHVKQTHPWTARAAKSPQRKHSFLLVSVCTNRLSSCVRARRRNLETLHLNWTLFFPFVTESLKIRRQESTRGKHLVLNIILLEANEGSNELRLSLIESKFTRNILIISSVCFPRQ